MSTRAGSAPDVYARINEIGLRFMWPGASVQIVQTMGGNPPYLVEIEGGLKPVRVPSKEAADVRLALFESGQALIAALEAEGLVFSAHPEISIEGDAMHRLGAPPLLVEAGRIKLQFRLNRTEQI